MKNHSYLATALSIVIGAVCSGVAQAECHARDLNLDQMMAAVRELNDSTANLKALQAIDTGNGLLPVAIQVTDRASVELTMFAGYIVIYNQLTNAADRKVTDDFIRDGTRTHWNSAKGYADFLTLVATGVPKFGDEIRRARDRIRKSQELFSCASQS